MKDKKDSVKKEEQRAARLAEQNGCKVVFESQTQQFSCACHDRLHASSLASSVITLASACRRRATGRITYA